MHLIPQQRNPSEQQSVKFATAAVTNLNEKSTSTEKDSMERKDDDVLKLHLHEKPSASDESESARFNNEIEEEVE